MNRFEISACLVASAIIVVQGCGKGAVAFDVASEGRCDLHLCVSGPESKSLQEHECDINSLDVLIFRQSGGQMDSRSRLEGDNLNDVRIAVTKGHLMTYYVCANAPEGAFASVRDEASFLSLLCRLDYCAQTSLPMSGFGNGTFTQDSESVDVRLFRLPCKVSIRKISLPFLSGQSWSESVVFKGVHLVNACGSEPWNGTASASGEVWYNAFSLEPSLPAALDPLLGKTVSIPVTGNDALSLEGYDFYCMPNPTVDPLRTTRLSLEFEIGGQPNWYPMDIPHMQSGCHYLITDVTLLGYGSDSPDKKVERTGVTFTVSIIPWATAFSDVEL